MLSISSHRGKGAKVDDLLKTGKNLLHILGYTTLERRQSKTLLTIDERGSKIVFLKLPLVANRATNGNQKTVSNDF